MIAYLLRFVQEVQLLPLLLFYAEHFWTPGSPKPNFVERIKNRNLFPNPLLSVLLPSLAIKNSFFVVFVYFLF